MITNVFKFITKIEYKIKCVEIQDNANEIFHLLTLSNEDYEDQILSRAFICF